ncbi:MULTISPECIES: hypothetical protein [unclassified Paenibacillus]|uniref:hypothetical protein n=1 Tax=unclassified Paenibacillus TaxID=185978 RepID=UPI0010E8694B|nr:MULTISPECIES: hypothetical protein [unclassified Paenibacillus]NIK68382.1 asparagine N-glycosylation enzyme membrane subunit Stt3 [Paenibacillus sp. BK720]TCM99331.1 hypothetical protein EV294_102627 [Paenibacillus sp. BK033]
MMMVPTNKRDEFYFGVMMVTGMALVMITYNLMRNHLFGTLSPGELILQYVLGFIVAFAVEMFVVGPLAKKAAFAMPYDKSKKLYVILALAFCMVTGMVLSMSLYGLISSSLSGSLGDGSLIVHYLTIVFHNYILAFPLQLIVMGPLVRFLFGKYVAKHSVKLAA